MSIGHLGRWERARELLAASGFDITRWIAHVSDRGRFPGNVAAADPANARRHIR